MKSRKTHKLRKIDDLAEKYAELDKDLPKAVKDKLKKDILVRNKLKNLEIDAQKRVIFEIKSPFNFIFRPSFSTGSPVGEGREDVEVYIYRQRDSNF